MQKLRWFRLLITMPPGCLPVEVFWARPAGRQPCRLRPRWRGYMYLTWPGNTAGGAGKARGTSGVACLQHFKSWIFWSQPRLPTENGCNKEFAEVEMRGRGRKMLVQKRKTLHMQTAFLGSDRFVGWVCVCSHSDSFKADCLSDSSTAGWRARRWWQQSGSIKTEMMRKTVGGSKKKKNINIMKSDECDVSVLRPAVIGLNLVWRVNEAPTVTFPRHSRTDMRHVSEARKHWGGPGEGARGGKEEEERGEGEKRMGGKL